MYDAFSTTVTPASGPLGMADPVPQYRKYGRPEGRIRSR